LEDGMTGGEAPVAPKSSAFERHRVLLLNADYRPLGFPIFTLTAPQVVTALLLERVEVVRESAVVARSPRLEMKLPSVVALRRYVNIPGLTGVPPCNRFNLFVRDRGVCQYTGLGLSYRSPDKTRQATVDHVLPVSRGGDTSWKNCVIASLPANIQKGGRKPDEAGLHLAQEPWVPSGADLLTLWLTEERLKHLDRAWVEFLAVPPSARVQRVLEKLAA
jgi:5-methylcytosine-specific restriction endonuclease McrA